MIRHDAVTLFLSCSPSFFLSLSLYLSLALSLPISIYMYIYISIYTYIYMYGVGCRGLVRVSDLLLALGLLGLLEGLGLLPSLLRCFGFQDSGLGFPPQDSLILDGQS